MTTYPFQFDPGQPFVEQASDWIADVFYDILPEAGFETRDEQIYMAFQLEKAFSGKQTIFAEAGVGTGKTLVYLLYAVTYARYTGRPAVIACADESLIEQLVKPEGDIAKLARHLDLRVDARLSKSMDQYVCLNKLDLAVADEDDDSASLYRALYANLPEFVHKPAALQSFYPYGDRKDYPELADDEWSRIAWDVFQDCLICPQRHRCGQTISRDYYRKATDLIICSHDFYMEHVWTYEARKREGQLPLLPEHSSVVFDEGHLLETATQNALTYKLKHHLFESIVTRLLEGEIRESLALAVEASIEQSERLFELLSASSRIVPGSDRREIILNDQLAQAIFHFRQLIGDIEEELVFESGLFSLDDYQLKIVEEHLEMIGHALSLFAQPQQVITWLVKDHEGMTLVIMPKKVKEVLRERVFSRAMPVVFSSATLSVNGSFDYIAQGLGIENFLSFSVASPYRYAEKMQLDIHPQQSDQSKLEKVLELMSATDGGLLILFPSFEELKWFRTELEWRAEHHSRRYFFEGSGEISHLISGFQRDHHSVLCAVTLWEGLDIPGPSLSHVIIWSLPFPPNDAVFTARRNDAAAPFEEVDLPYMLLRLKQGIGRLIRSSEDSGTVTIFGGAFKETDIREQIRQFL
ncbi:ATP-dependent DNA helicase [Paenibacillus sp. GCM10012307]|uniref:ATP-dependent DNA helicase n=1 Tax=Paenibacillus roseus TaxID=2798579 RepID=A0A934MNY2_9BACL|nr:ATP-dependent DNA helicase [Paenibacillus roseus]MBJ6360308.1 ATP-dependent DNA helicase [Paenibacillus roseus]